MSRQSRGFQKMKMTAHVKFMRGLGYRSLIFPAKYDGGKCALTGKSIARGADVAYFREHGLCLELSVRALLESERLAKAPKCGCGREATEMRDGVARTCVVCEVIARTWFDMPGAEVTRNTNPSGN